MLYVLQALGADELVLGVPHAVVEQAHPHRLVPVIVPVPLALVPREIRPGVRPATVVPESVRRADAHEGGPRHLQQTAVAEVVTDRARMAGAASLKQQKSDWHKNWKGGGHYPGGDADDGEVELLDGVADDVADDHVRILPQGAHLVHVALVRGGVAAQVGAAEGVCGEGPMAARNLVQLLHHLPVVVRVYLPIEQQLNILLSP